MVFCVVYVNIYIYNLELFISVCMQIQWPAASGNIISTDGYRFLSYHELPGSWHEVTGMYLDLPIVAQGACATQLGSSQTWWTPKREPRDAGMGDYNYLFKCFGMQWLNGMGFGHWGIQHHITMWVQRILRCKWSDIRASRQERYGTNMTQFAPKTKL